MGIVFQAYGSDEWCDFYSYSNTTVGNMCSATHSTVLASPALAEFSLLESGSPPHPPPNYPYMLSSPNNMHAAAKCNACCCKPTSSNAATAMSVPHCRSSAP